MPKPATIIDIAKRARVSMKTVSRALRDEPHVSENVRARVLDAARELDYRPNLFARSLASKRSYLVGLVRTLRNPAPAYVMTVQDGVHDRCEEKGFNLLTRTFNADDKGIASAVLQFVEKTQVEGLVITPPLADSKALARALVAADIPHIRISQSGLVAGSHRVGTNEAEISAEVTRHLLRLGHRQIAFIKGHPAHSGSVDRFNGFLAAMREAELEPPRRFVLQGMFTFDSGFECGRKLLSGRQAPTAIFASNDYMAAGVVNAAHRMGVSIPGELSVVGFDDAPVAEQIWPALTTVSQPVRKLGQLATEKLFELIDSGGTEGEQEAPECRMVIRESTGEPGRDQ